MEGAGTRRCFCLSKGRDGAQLGADSNADPSSAALREQLQTLRPVALSKRARAEGVGDDLVEEALDSAEPKSALIDLIVRFAEEQALGDDADLRIELEGMRLAALQARAAAEHIGEDAVDDALEADNPKAALVALIVGHASRDSLEADDSRNDLILGPKGRAVYPLHTPTQVSLVEGLVT